MCAVSRATTLAALIFSLVTLGCSEPARPTDGTDPESESDPSGLPSHVVVDIGVALGMLDGFGSFTLPLVYPDGDYLGDLRSAALQAVYGDVGLNLGLLSHGVTETPADAIDPWTARRNDNADPEVMNPAGFNGSSIETMRRAVLAPATTLNPRATVVPTPKAQNERAWAAW